MKKRTIKTFTLHHWCGLIAGIFLLAISLSGSILVFHDELDDTFYKKELHLEKPEKTLSIDASFEKIRSSHPGWEIRLPGLPEKEDQALKYELRQGNLRKWITVNPASGAILHIINRADNRLVNILLTLHYSFFAGTPGKIFVFICGLAFLILLITGILLYRKSFIKVLTFRQRISLKSRKSFLSSLHRILGVWGLLFNLLICITGLWMAYVVISGALKKSDLPINTPPTTQSIDRMLTKVKKELPDFEIHYIRFPTNPTEKLSISGRLTSDPAYYGKFYSRLQADYFTGQLTSVQLLREKPTFDRFTTILQPLHFGNYAGLGVKIIYSLGGLLPGILSISGFFIWLFKSKQKKNKFINVKA